MRVCRESRTVYKRHSWKARVAEVGRGEESWMQGGRRKGGRVPGHLESHRSNPETISLSK